MSLTNQQLADKLDLVATGFQTFVDEIRAFMTTPIDGGPNSDGYVQISDAVITDLIPGLMKLKNEMLRGIDAAQDISLFVQGLMGNSEVLHIYTHRGATTTMDIANSAAKCETAPTATKVVSILKNGSAWATVTFTAGQTTGVIACASPTITTGDVLKWVAPATQDPTFSNFFMTLAGA